MAESLSKVHVGCALRTMMSIADPLLSNVSVFKTENRERNLADISDWNYDFQTVSVNSPLFSLLNTFMLTINLIQFTIIQTFAKLSYVLGLCLYGKENNINSVNSVGFTTHGSGQPIFRL